MTHPKPIDLDAIEARHTDYDRWVSYDEPSEQAHVDRAALLSEVRKLREALEPFACRTGGFLGDITDADVSRACKALGDPS